MLVKYWMNSAEEKEMSVSEVLTYEVQAVNSERGALEDLEARVEKLTAILAAVAEELPADAQKRIVTKTCMFHVPR